MDLIYNGMEFKNILYGTMFDPLIVKTSDKDIIEKVMVEFKLVQDKALESVLDMMNGGPGKGGYMKEAKHIGILKHRDYEHKLINSWVSEYHIEGDIYSFRIVYDRIEPDKEDTEFLDTYLKPPEGWQGWKKPEVEK